MAEIYSRLDRAKMFIRYFIEKYQPICSLCGERLDWMSFYPKLSGLKRDELTKHHINHNPKDNRPKNLCLVHRACHRRHHREEQIFKQNNRGRYSYTILDQEKVKKTVEV